jgi:hypothetical protein
VDQSRCSDVEARWIRVVVVTQRCSGSESLRRRRGTADQSRSELDRGDDTDMWRVRVAAAMQR